MKRLMIFLIIAIAISSCNLFKAAIAPKYDSYAASTAQAISSQQFNMWERMKTGSSSFTDNSLSEDSIVNELQVLVTYDSGRKHGEAITKLTKDWRDRMVSISQEHQSYVTLNVSQIQSYQNSMNNIANIVFKTELNYKP